MSDIVQQGFDYSGYEAQDVARLETLSAIMFADAQAVGEILARHADHLMEAQEIHKRRKGYAGDFVAWVDTKTPYDNSSAYKLMNARQRLGSEFGRASELGKRKLFLLGSAPKEAIPTLLQQAEDGTIETTRQLEAAIKDVKTQAETAVNAAAAEARRARAEAETARQQAQATQQRLMEVQSADERRQRDLVATQQRATAAEQAIEELETQLETARNAAKVTQQIVEKIVEKPIPDPAQSERIAALEVQLAAAQRDRQAAAARALELQQELEASADRHAVSDQEWRIKVQWSDNANKIIRALREAVTLFPPEQDTLAFDDNDWAYYREIAAIAQQILNHTRRQHNIITVDAA
jgi:DNA repair exonuclease SbcCD ATPase subunit